ERGPGRRRSTIVVSFIVPPRCGPADRAWSQHAGSDAAAHREFPPPPGQPVGHEAPRRAYRSTRGARTETSVLFAPDPGHTGGQGAPPRRPGGRHGGRGGRARAAPADLSGPPVAPAAVSAVSSTTDVRPMRRGRSALGGR